jgi:Spy/CpxP family protein refolding chaperone
MNRLSDFKKPVMLGFLLMLFFTKITVSAKGNDMVEQRVNKLQKELNLSEEQTNRVRQVLDYNYQQAQKEHEENKGNPEALINAAKARQEITDRQMQNVLTPEQYQEYQEISKNSVTDAAALKLKERLALTDEQTGQVAQIYAATRDEMQKMRENNSGDRRRMREQMRALIEKQDKQIEALLTGEQKEIYEDVKKERQEEMQKRMPGGRGGKKPW